MNLAALAALAVLVVGPVAAEPADDVLTPTGIPATSAPPFSTLSFDTTAVASSVLSALSSLISSESTAIMPFTAPTQSVPTGTTATSGSTPSASSSSPSSTATQTSGASSLGLMGRPGHVASIGFAVLGTVAALVY